MKTAGKKIASIFLALALCMSLACTAFAASGNTGKITIDGTSGETYNIYQIFDLTYTSDDSGAPSNDASYSYKVVDAWAAFFAAGAAGAEYVTLDDSGYVTSFTLDEDNAAAFASAALAWAAAQQITPSQSVTLQENQASATFENLPLGYYLVGSSLGTVCMLDNTTPDVTITEKNKTPTVAIYVWDTTKGQDQNDEDTSDDAAVVDSLMYEIVISQAAGSSNLVLHNAANADLVYNMQGITVSVVTDTGTVTVDPSDYTITTDVDDQCTIHISFTDAFLATLGDNDQISIQVPATITGNSEDFDADEAIYDNFAWVSYGNAGISETAEADVYSYGFEINKYTGDSTENRLAGAKFVLSNSDGKYATFGENSVLSGWVDSQDEASVLESMEDYNIVLDGLDQGTYTLTEIAAPDGYNMLEDPLIINILPVEGSNYADFVVTVGEGEPAAEATNNVVDVQNNAGSELPSTGGIGTTIFYIIGGVLVAGAVVVLITRRRMTSGD